MSALAALARRHLWLAPLAGAARRWALAIGIMRPTTFAMDQINIKIAAAMTLILIATGETIVMTARRHRPFGRRHPQPHHGHLRHARRSRPCRIDACGSASSWRSAPASGVLNGLIISFGRLQPFVVTLATWSILEGCALTVLPAETSGVPKSWVALEHAMPFGIGVPMILLGVLIVLWVWFSRTRIYNAVRAAGSNERSAFLNRVSVLGTNAWAYGLSGFFAAAAGLYFATQTGAGHPTVGTQYVLPAIAAVVIGGTSLAGGRATLVGTIVGAFILTLIGDVVFLLKLQSYWQWVMSGLILMLVVVLTALTESRSSAGQRIMKRCVSPARSSSPMLAALLLFVAGQPLFAGLRQPGACRDAGHPRRVHRHRRDRADDGHHRRRHRSLRALDPEQRRHSGDRPRPRPELAAGLDRAADPPLRRRPSAWSTASASRCCASRRSS